MNIMAFLQSLSGYKTYILAAILIAYLFGANQGWWVMDSEIAAILAALGGVALRAGVAKAAPIPNPQSTIHNPQSPPPPTTALIPILASVCLLLGTSCSSVAPGNDPVVVNAERTTQLAVDTFDGFLQWEYDNRAYLSQWPQVKQIADRIRTDAPRWLTTARTLTKVYKQHRSPDAKANLITAIAVLQAALRETGSLMAATAGTDAQAITHR